MKDVTLKRRKKIMDEKHLNYDDFTFDEDEKKYVRSKVNEDDARKLIQRYGGMIRSEKDMKEYDEWRKGEAMKGIVFTPDPLNEDENEIWDDTDDSDEMKERLKKREMYSHHPLDQLFNRYEIISDNEKESEDATPNTNDNINDNIREEENNNDDENLPAGVTRIGGSIYYDRDPYQTDTDQSVDDGSDDIDSEGNLMTVDDTLILQREPEEHIRSTEDTKENDEESINDGKAANAIYTNEEVNTLENEDGWEI